MKLTLTTVFAALAISSASAQMQFTPPEMPASQQWTDIDYVGDGIEGHKLDIYLPKGFDGPYKPIVIIYGSAWFANNAKGAATASLGKPLLDAGFAIVSINHRGSPEAKYPAQINDVKAALRFIRGNADKFSLDTTFVGVTGFSSGGHLSALAGATNGVKTRKSGDLELDIEGILGSCLDHSSDVNAVVDWFGPIDMNKMEDCITTKDERSPEAVLIGGAPADNPDMITLLNPSTYLSENSPKFMVIHGTSDSVVPYCQSEMFAENLANAGLLEKFISVPGGEHGPETSNDSTFEEMVRFFVREANGVRDFVYDGYPLVSNKFTADPAPMVSNGKLYLYVGHDEWYDGQDQANGGKEFNITEWLCYSTPDMVNWTDHGAVLAPHNFEWGVPKTAWASQVVEKDGKFYYYTTSQGKDDYVGYCVGVAVSDTPVGPFVDAIGKPLVVDQMTPNGTRGWWNDIDPTVLIDGEDAWLCWGNGTCFIAKLKPNMVEIDGEITTIDLPKYIEGPWLDKVGDTYYLIYASAGEAGEAIDYATAPAITGPWTPQGQVTGSAANSFTIHPGVAHFNGKHYLFYHNAAQSIDGHAGAIGRRTVCFDELEYNPDGTIIFVEQKSALPK